MHIDDRVEFIDLFSGVAMGGETVFLMQLAAAKNEDTGCETFVFNRQEVNGLTATSNAQYHMVLGRPMSLRD